MASVGRLRLDITDGNIFLFKYYFGFPPVRVTAPASDRFYQLEIEAIRRGEIHLHPGVTVADRDGAARAAIDDVAAGREHRPHRQRARLVRYGLEEAQSLIAGLAERADRGAVRSEHRAIAALEVVVGPRSDAGEIAGGAEQVFAVVGADSEQHGLVHRPGQPQRRGAEAAFAERAIERDAVGADQRDQDDVRPRGTDALQMRLVVVFAEGNELFADDMAAGLLDVALHRAVRLPGPDIIAADQVPARRLLDVGKPVDGGAALPARRLADRHDTRRLLAALVDGRIDVGDTVACRDLAQRHTHRAGMQSHDEVDLIGSDRLLGAAQNPVERPAGIVDRKLDLAPENAAALVDLGDRELRAACRARAPDTGRAGAADKAPDAELVVCAAALHEMRISRRQAKTPCRGRQIPKQKGRRYRRTAVSREVYRRAHANSCLIPDLKAHSAGGRGTRPIVGQYP